MKAKFILSLSTLLIFASCKNEQTIDPTFMGKVERSEISVVTKVPGTIEQILVKEGDFVSKGDTLAILEIPEVDAKKEQAFGVLKSADAQYSMAKKGATEGQLKQLQAKVNGLKEQYEFAEKSLNRLSSMLQDSLIPQQKYDEVYAKYQGAKNQYLAAVVEMEDAKSGARNEQQQMALGQRQRAQGAISEIQTAEREKYMIAPQDMSIETISLKIGELALPGYPIFSGYLNASTYFRFTIPESKLGKLKPGEIVNINLVYTDAEKIAGEVVLVKALSSYANIATAYPDFDIQQALFEVKIRPLDPKRSNELVTKTSVLLEHDK